MSNRKPATASKHSRSTKRAARSERTKVAARSQRTKQSLVRSPKENPLRVVGPSSEELSAARHNDSKQEARNRHHDVNQIVNQMMSGVPTKMRFDLPFATSNVQALQARLLGWAQANMQLAQANMQFAFEFSGRLVAIRSPFEIPGVIAEFTSKRIDIWRKYSQNMIEATVRRGG